jgi:DNA uptake protein ComE-like DNA-binding protein
VDVSSSRNGDAFSSPVLLESPMKRLSVLAAAAVLFAFAAPSAMADGVINLRKPEPDAFGNEPSTAITPRATLRINLMSHAELIARPEIGSLHAQKVIAGRPYVGQDDFRTRSGLPQENYDRIKDVLDF